MRHFTRLIFAAAMALAGCATDDAAPEARQADAPVVLRHAAGPDELTVRADPRFAGAVSSVTFRGAEYVDAADHGRLMQGAVFFDGLGECLNPTQGGASRDRGRSTSRLLSSQPLPGGGWAGATRMAYWKRPGEHCEAPARPERAAVNRTRLSDVVYAQRLTPGYGGRANAVLSEISFTSAEPRADAVVAALTAYTPARFSTFHRLTAEGRLVAAPEGGRIDEQPDPVIVATRDGRHALGFLSLTTEPTPLYVGGRWPDVNQLTVVFRPGAWAPGVHAYRCVSVVGTLEEVAETIRAIRAG